MKPEDIKLTVALAKFEIKLDNVIADSKENKELFEEHLKSHDKLLKTIRKDFITKEEVKPLRKFIDDWRRIETKIGRTAIVVIASLTVLGITYFAFIKDKLGL